MTEVTGKKYIEELLDKYSAGTRIANVPSNRVGGTNEGLNGDIGSGINGNLILEVPVQNGNIPAGVLQLANQRNVKIRDITGKIY